jgi:hypothetical protein
MKWPDAAEREGGHANRIPAPNQIQRIFPWSGFHGSVPPERLSMVLPCKVAANAGCGSFLSSFGTFGQQTDAQNPQVNR